MEIDDDHHLSDKPHETPPREQASPRTKQRGGWRAIKYILGNESFEKLASMSLIANLTVYLSTKYNMEGVKLVTTITIWSGSSNLTSLLGAFLSDAFLGRFLTLLLGSIASFLGMVIFTFTAVMPKLTPPKCKEGQTDCIEADAWQLAVLYGGLVLLSIGAGGIRPCNIAFGADQFDTSTRKGRRQLESFFNWWYLSFTVALLIALTAVVYIQTSISWVIGFAIPTVCLALSITLFLLGCKTYVYMKPQGSVFVDVFKVINATLHKRRQIKVMVINDDSSLYDPPVDGSKHLAHKLPRTDKFKCLERAAIIIDPSELDNQGRPIDNWRLCSVQQVEQLKCLVGILPVWLTAIGTFVAMDQQSTFGILQAIQMNKHFGKFEMPPGWMTLYGMIALSLWILAYQRVYIPIGKKVTKKDPRLTMTQRIQIGIVFSILCMLVAAIIEKKRREAALKHGSFESPLHIAYLFPQFVLSGMTEALGAIAVMEFFTMQLPESMRTVAGAIFFLSLSLASYTSSLLVNIIHWLSGLRGHSPWIGGHDLNKNKLDYYYYLIAGIGVANFFYFTFFARHYVLCGNGKEDQAQAQAQAQVEVVELEEDRKDIEKQAVEMTNK